MLDGTGQLDGGRLNPHPHLHAQQPAAQHPTAGGDTAPKEVRFCSRCGTGMVTRPIAGRARRTCPSCGFVHFVDPKVAVGTVVVLAGRLLLVRRTMEPHRGRWSLPAGFLDAGEDPRAAAARETLEEAGVAIDVGELLDVVAKPSGSATLFLVYRATYVGNEPRAGDDADAAAFFGPDKLPELAFESTRAAVRRWLSDPAERPAPR